jgi:hypothetical protein
MELMGALEKRNAPYGISKDGCPWLARYPEYNENSDLDCTAQACVPSATPLPRIRATCQHCQFIRTRETATLEP